MNLSAIMSTVCASLTSHPTLQHPRKHNTTVILLLLLLCPPQFQSPNLPVHNNHEPKLNPDAGVQVVTTTFGLRTIRHTPYGVHSLLLMRATHSPLHHRQPPCLLRNKVTDMTQGVGSPFQHRTFVKRLSVAFTITTQPFTTPCQWRRRTAATLLLLHPSPPNLPTPPYPLLLPDNTSSALAAPVLTD